MQHGSIKTLMGNMTACIYRLKINLDKDKKTGKNLYAKRNGPFFLKYGSYLGGTGGGGVANKQAKIII